MTTSIETTSYRFNNGEITVASGHSQLGTLAPHGFEYIISDKTNTEDGKSKIIFQQMMYSLEEIQEASMKLKYNSWTTDQYDAFIESRTRHKRTVELMPGTEISGEQIRDIFGEEYTQIIKKVSVT